MHFKIAENVTYFLAINMPTWFSGTKFHSESISGDHFTLSLKAARANKLKNGTYFEIFVLKKY